jgi:hypothetical protein
MALREWFDRSWFLDEAADADITPSGGVKPPPAMWRLGSRPNLKQMHADRPRKERNAIVVAVPSRDGVQSARSAIRDHLGWVAVGETLKKEGHELDLIRQQNLDAYASASFRKIADAIHQAYCIVVTVSAENDVQAFRIQPTDGPLFTAIKADSRARIQETAISPDAVLPAGRISSGETTRSRGPCATWWARSPGFRISRRCSTAGPSWTRSCADARRGTLSRGFPALTSRFRPGGGRRRRPMCSMIRSSRSFCHIAPNWPA